MSTRKRLQQHVRLALTQGTQPEKIALSLAIGTLMGIIPLVWGSSVICVGIGWRWQLNHALLQASNYAAYPLQIVLFVPFFEAANRLFAKETLLNPRLLHHLLNSPLQIIDQLWLVNLQALMLWLLGSIILFPILYRTFLSVVQRHFSRLRVRDTE